MIPIHKDAQKQIKMMYYARQSSSRLAAIVGVYSDTDVKPQHRLCHLPTAAPPPTVVLNFL